MFSSDSRSRRVGCALIALACWVGWAAARGDGPPAGGNGAFVVPDGEPAALFAFIDEMRASDPPAGATPKQIQAFVFKSHMAIVEAADKILATKPASEVRFRALQAKVDALAYLKDRPGGDEAAVELGRLANKLKADKQPEVAALVEPYIGLGAKATRPWSEVKPKLAATPEDRALVREAIQAVEKVEEAGQTKRTVRAYRDLQGILANSRDPKIAAQAKQFNGVVRRLTVVGKQMEFRGQTVDGAELKADQFKNKVVLVQFWATWCPYCRTEIKNVQTNYAKYHERGFEVVGVSVDSDKQALTKYVANQNISWPITFHAPKQGADLAAYYGVSTYPTGFLVNRKGEVVSTTACGDELPRRLQQMLGK